MTTLSNYTIENHKQFTTAIIKIEDKLYFVYKNKGYTEKSTIYGSIYQIRQGENLNVTFKTKKQVINFLNKQ